MSIWQVYLRVIALLGPERRLASWLAAANLGNYEELMRQNGLFAELSNQGSFAADAVESNGQQQDSEHQGDA
jgi:hypothetical protein